MERRPSRGRASAPFSAPPFSRRLGAGSRYGRAAGGAGFLVRGECLFALGQPKGLAVLPGRGRARVAGRRAGLLCAAPGWAPDVHRPALRNRVGARRPGRDGRRFPWGDVPRDGLAVTGRHRAGRDYTASTLPAAQVSARLGMSPFGLHHMAGNVWHWCRDSYDPAFYQRAESRLAQPQNDRETGIRSERGGSWVGPIELAACSYRRGRSPSARGRCLGFRCVGDVPDQGGPPESTT